jgi:pilus assembly protein Flp/PilA
MGAIGICCGGSSDRSGSMCSFRADTQVCPYVTAIPKQSKTVVREMMFLPCDEGQGLVEYALILVFVAMIVIVVLLFLGPEMGNVFSNIIANI